MLKLESLDKSKRKEWVGPDIIVPTFIFFKNGQVVADRMVNPEHKNLEAAVNTFVEKGLVEGVDSPHSPLFL